jgi:hypothetical protein
MFWVAHAFGFFESVGLLTLFLSRSSRIHRNHSPASYLEALSSFLLPISDF